MSLSAVPRGLGVASGYEVDRRARQQRSPHSVAVGLGLPTARGFRSCYRCGKAASALAHLVSGRWLAASTSFRLSGSYLSLGPSPIPGRLSACQWLAPGARRRGASSRPGRVPLSGASRPARLPGLPVRVSGPARHWQAIWACPARSLAGQAHSVESYPANPAQRHEGSYDRTFDEARPAAGPP